MCVFVRVLLTPFRGTELQALQHECQELRQESKRLSRRLVLVEEENASLRYVQADVSKEVDAARRHSLVTAVGSRRKEGMF